MEVSGKSRSQIVSQLISAITGFHADLNATYPVGQIDGESEKLIQTTKQALDEAMSICKPGALYR
jgi:methionine aminopeptidase